MVFIYPALLSENVDKRYLHGLIKTIELYLLSNIVESISNGRLRFYVKRNRNGRLSDVKIESSNLPSELEPWMLIQESDSNEELYKKEIDTLKTELGELYRRITNLKHEEETAVNTLKDKIVNINKEKSKGGNRAAVDLAYHKKDQAEVELETIRNKLKDLEKQHATMIVKISEREADHYRERRSDIDRKEREKKDDERKNLQTPSTSGGSVDVNTSAILDLRPTTISVDIPIHIKDKSWIPGLTSQSMNYENSRKIPISVKVLPLTAKNFGDMYSILIDDMYTNKYSAKFRAVTRFFGSKFQRWFGRVGRIFTKLFVPKGEGDIYADILYSSKGFVDASSFRNSSRGPSYQHYASSFVIMSSDDIRHQEQNFFDDPKKMMKLYKMGWNSFCIMDDADQKMTFCSYLENGTCTKIPYQYLFHSLKALDIYKEMEQLSGFTRRVIGRFGSIKMRNVGESINIKLESEDRITYIFDQYMRIADESRRRS